MTAGGQQERKVDYLALGDSYISGEGAGAYRQGTDTERNRCHQSLNAYPYLLGSQFNSFSAVSCSGARSQHIVKQDDSSVHQVYGASPSQAELDSAKAQYWPGYREQRLFVSDDNPEAVTISIGGNDIGFSDIMMKCVHPLKAVSGAAHSTCYQSYEDRLEVVNLINRRLSKLRQLYKDLRESGSGVRRVYVIGYPQVAKPNGVCGLNVAMNLEEVQFSHDLIAYFNSVIKQAADEAGVVYVDTQQAFDGHRLCEAGEPAMNGITVRPQLWGGFGVVESFHPNQLGHRLLAEAVAAQTQSLTRVMPEAVAPTAAKPVDPTMPLLKNAPLSNRPVNKVHIGERGEAVLPKDSPLLMVMNGQDYDIKPNSAYRVTLHSTPIDLGSFTSGADGMLRISATVPASAETGYHTVHVRGVNTFNEPIDIQTLVYVAAGAEDYDGDGVPNDIDSCGLAAQSGVDMDLDNTDDACDPSVMIVTAPPDPEGVIWRDDAILSIDIQAHAGP
jgi:lysophospholipase L1-like esterase